MMHQQKGLANSTRAVANMQVRLLGLEPNKQSMGLALGLSIVYVQILPTTIQG